VERIGRSRIHSLYYRYRGNVFDRAQQLLRNKAEAEDATQDVFLRLLVADERMLAHPEPLAWLYRVTSNLCLNRLRDDTRHTAIIARNPPGDCQQQSNAEMLVIVGDILERVPRDLRDIAISYHVDGMTCDEISARLGVSRRTIGNRLLAFQWEASDMTGHA
jgi:RNA polymerase sigma-70 factor (ECF subfamily)